MKKIEGSVYKGHNNKVYVIYPVPKEYDENNEGVDYIVAETKFMLRAGRQRDAEDELLVHIELGDTEK
jgi:hypothetical protein